MSHLVVQEPDRVPGGKAVLVGVASMLIFAAGVLAAWLLLEGRQRKLQPHGPAPIPAELGQVKIGIVHQNMYGVPAGPDLLQAQRDQLGSYGWVDKARGVAHIPIERAMEIMAKKGGRP